LECPPKDRSGDSHLKEWMWLLRPEGLSVARNRNLDDPLLSMPIKYRPSNIFFHDE
jgi:hypothetical protein